LTSSAR